MDPCLRECCLAIGLINSDQTYTKTQAERKLKKLCTKLGQLEKRLDRELSSPEIVPIAIVKPVVVKVEPIQTKEEPLSIEETIANMKQVFNDKVQSIVPHLQLNEKKKQLTQIRKNYYTWYLDYVTRLLLETCGHHKLHRKHFLTRTPPTYTHEQLRNVSEKLMNLRHNKSHDGIEDVDFLTDTRDRKIRQDILKLFVTYQNYLDLYLAYDGPYNPSVLEACKKRIEAAQLMHTIAEHMYGNLQYYVKKFEKKFEGVKFQL